MNYEYKTTYDSWNWTPRTGDLYPIEHKEYIPDPEPPKGDGWELVCATTWETTHFWFWRRKVSTAKKRVKKS